MVPNIQRPLCIRPALTPALNPIQRRSPHGRVFCRSLHPIGATCGIELSLESCGLKVRLGRRMKACLLPEEHVGTDVDSKAVCVHTESDLLIA